MRLLITGATGFVGREAVTQLARRGYQIRAAARDGTARQFTPDIEIAQHGDLAGGIDWAPLVANCDAIVHLAGIAHADARIAAAQYDLINHRTTADLVRAAERAGCSRFVFMSSIRAQSGPAADHVLTEAEEPRPSDAYGASKLAAEAGVRASSLRYTILRPVLVYGAGAKGNLAALARLAASPWPLPFGALANRRSLLNRASLIDAIDLALTGPKTARETFIVADERPISLRDLVAALRRGMGRPPGLLKVPRAALRLAFRLGGRARDLDRLEGDLIANPAKLVAAGWRPTTDTAQAIERLAQELLAP